MPAVAAKDIDRQIRRVVSSRFETLADLQEYHEEIDLSEIAEVLGADLPDHVRKDLLNNKQEVSLYEQLINEAPTVTAKGNVHRFNEHKVVLSGLREEAAFRLGLEVGRRLGGAR